jgi:hypothetical protein
VKSSASALLMSTAAGSDIGTGVVVVTVVAAMREMTPLGAVATVPSFMYLPRSEGR